MKSSPVKRSPVKSTPVKRSPVTRKNMKNGANPEKRKIDDSESDEEMDDEEEETTGLFYRVRGGLGLWWGVGVYNITFNNISIILRW